MKIFVTGAHGQVGAQLVHLGAARGLQMIAAGHAELDITDLDAVEALLHEQAPDIVINAAAYTAVDQAESEPEKAEAINGLGPAHLAKTCAALDIPLLHISTDYVFDGNSTQPYGEEDRPNPQGVYGATKLQGEEGVVANVERHIILRVAWVFGTFGQNFVRTMLRLAGSHPELRIVADQHGGPTWAGDIAKTLLDIAVRYHGGKAIAWGIYHYNGSPFVSWCEFAEAIFAESLKQGMIERCPTVIPIPSSEYPTPAKRPLNSRLNCQKIKKHLAITAPDWRNGLIHTLTDWNT